MTTISQCATGFFKGVHRASSVPFLVQTHSNDLQDGGKEIRIMKGGDNLIFFSLSLIEYFESLGGD